MGHQHDDKCGQKGSCNTNKGHDHQQKHQERHQPQPEKKGNGAPPSKGPQNKPFKK